MQEWLTAGQQRSNEDAQSIIDGFKRALSREALPLVTFEDFAVNYQWLAKTLQASVQSFDCNLPWRLIESSAAYLLCRS